MRPPGPRDASCSWRKSPRNGRSRELLIDAQPRRFTQHRAHHQPCALHLRRARRLRVPPEGRNPCRRRPDLARHARSAGAKRDDRAHPPRTQVAATKRKTYLLRVAGFVLLDKSQFIFTAWCNGNTAPFGGVIHGSNPCAVAIRPFCKLKASAPALSLSKGRMP